MSHFHAWMQKMKQLLFWKKHSKVAPSFKHPSEEWVANWLQSQGLTLLTHNYQTRGGEIDLIMQDDITIVFVEVRLRKSQNYGLSSETIDSRKQQKLLKTAQHYLQHTNNLNSSCRFDVVCIQYDKTGSPLLQWYKHAFTE